MKILLLSPVLIAFYLMATEHSVHAPKPIKLNCPARRKEALKNKQKDDYIPACEPNGDFSPRQCGPPPYCFCVRPNGEEIPGTRNAAEKVKCSKRNRRRGRATRRG